MLSKLGCLNLKVYDYDVSKFRKDVVLSIATGNDYFYCQVSIYIQHKLDSFTDKWQAYGTFRIIVIIVNF